MNRTKLLATAVLVAVGATSIGASAQTQVPVQASHPRIDINGDGYIDRSEAAAMPKLAERFDALDTDRDGRLSRQERPGRTHTQGGHGRMAAFARARMAQLDTDGDRRISRAEAPAGEVNFAGRFDKMDVNKDDFVDRDDRLQRAKQRGGEWFTKADTNRDGQLSGGEFDAARSSPPHAMRRGERAPRTP